MIIIKTYTFLQKGHQTRVIWSSQLHLTTTRSYELTCRPLKLTRWGKKAKVRLGKFYLLSVCLTKFTWNNIGSLYNNVQTSIVIVYDEILYLFHHWIGNHYSLGLTNPDDEMFDDITERVSQMRRPGEEDMAYYERRYQERVSP